MELEFQKNELCCLQQVLSDVRNLEQTQEVRIADGMPDIGSILGAWGQVLLRGKEWYNDDVSINGGVMVWVLYASEEDGTPQWIDTWVPFQSKFEIPNSHADGALRVSALLRNSDARTTSARKMMVRVNVSVLTQAYEPTKKSVYTCNDMPDDIQVLKNTYPMVLPGEVGERIFNVEEEMPLHISFKPHTLIRYTMTPTISETRVMIGKLVFRGNALVHLLFASEDGSLFEHNLEVPFSQFCELTEEVEPDAPVDMIPAVTSLEVELLPEGTVHIKAGMTVQYVVYKNPMVSLIEDVYSLGREITPEFETVQLPVVLDSQTEIIQAEQSVDVQATNIIETEFLPGQVRQVRTEDGVEITLNGQFQVLYTDVNGALAVATPRWEHRIVNRADTDNKITTAVVPYGKISGQISGNGIRLQSDISMEVVTTSAENFTAVKAVNMGETVIPSPERPCVILRTAGENTLWDMAKSCNSTVDAIMQVNQLQGEPDSNQMLLIPVM